MNKYETSPVLSEGQLEIAPVKDPTRYLGNAQVAYAFVEHFSRAVMDAYDAFLRGESTGLESQAAINALIKEYGGALMGRDPRFEIAPWQGEGLRDKFLVELRHMYGDDDPGEALFKGLALICVKACMAIKDGHDEDDVGISLVPYLVKAQRQMLGV